MFERLKPIAIPFDRLLERPLISSWVKAIDASPLDFVVATHPRPTFICGLYKNVCISEDAPFQFLRWFKSNARMNTALRLVVAVGYIPMSFDFAAIIVRVWNQKVRPAETNEKQKYADEVFISKR